MSNPRKKKRPKRVLALPDLEQSKATVLNSLSSESGQRTYDHAITEFVDWYCSEPRLTFNRTVVLRYRIYLEQQQYAPTTINLRLAAVRRVAFEAADAGLLSPELAAGIRRVKGVRRIGVRVGNGLTAEQGKRLLAGVERRSLRARGIMRCSPCSSDAGYDEASCWRCAWSPSSCARSTGSSPTFWVRPGTFVRFRSRGGRRMRPTNGRRASGITEGALFRSIHRTDRVWGTGMTPKVLWEIVREAASRAGIEKLAPHGLRRTCARLCRLAGGELDQIQFLLGHVSIQTTERYLGCKQSCAAPSTTGSVSSRRRPNRRSRRRATIGRHLPTRQE